MPPGVKTGSRVRVGGQGGSGIGGGAAGDLFLSVTVNSDPVFERDGDNLRTEVKVDLYTAILGGEAMVPTMAGNVRLKIPPETQPGRIFRLRGQGMPHVRDPQAHGDLLVKIQIDLPQNLSEEERSLFERLASLRRGG